MVIRSYVIIWNAHFTQSNISHNICPQDILQKYFGMFRRKLQLGFIMSVGFSRLSYLWVESPFTELKLSLCLKFGLNVCGSLQMSAIFRCNLASRFLSRPHPVRLATASWALNFLITLCVVKTGTSRSMEMCLQPWDCPCLAIILCLTTSYNPLVFFLSVHSLCGTKSYTKHFFSIIQTGWISDCEPESLAWNGIIFLEVNKTVQAVLGFLCEPM